MPAIKIFGKSIPPKNGEARKQVENLDDKLKEDKTFKLQGRISFRGLDIAVENKKGSVRRGVDDDGEKWETKMFYPYGYIRGSMGVDGDAVDCFIGPDKESDKVFVIHQENPENGKYDEDKVMLGFDSLDYARAAYLAHYDDQNFLGKITAMNFEEFKKKVLATKNKPGMIKSFGKLIKAFGSQLGFFDEPKHDIVEGETRVKNGKTYEIKRSTKNPNVRRLFKREEKEVRSRKSEEKQKPSLNLFGKQFDLFGAEKKKIKNEATKKIEEKKNPTTPKPQKEKPIKDLFTSSEKPRQSKKAEDALIENFGVGHLDSKVRAQRIELNKKVRELLAAKKDEEFTPEDKKLLAQYSGRGGTDEVSLNEYYTPEYVARFQWDMLKKLGYKGGPVLEPSCGTGMFLYTAPEDALVTGVEYDETSSRIASILFPEQEILHMPFEKFNVEKFDKEFKAAIGNVPFGQRGETSAIDPELAKYHTHEKYFMERMIDDLGEGGLISVIVPTGIMDNQQSDYRLELNKKAEFLGAIRMPTGVFKNANAQVTSDIVFFRKRPEAVIERLENLEGDELSKLYDTMILDHEFVNGTFFGKNPEYALGEETTGNYGMKIWKGDITPEDLKEKGELIKHFETDYSILGDLGIETEEERELHVGDTIMRNGRLYQLNENHRWERLENLEERKTYLPEDTQKILGIKTHDELGELQHDISRLMDLSREQLKEVSLGLGEELEYYTSSNVQKNEMLKRAVVLGLAIKDFQRRMQTGEEKKSSTGMYYYEPVSTSDAQREAQQLAMMLEDFKTRYGHPSKDAKLGAQMGKSPDNPILYLISSFDNEGNLSKLFTDPKSFYNVYHPSMWTVQNFDAGNLLDTIAMLKGNGFSNSAESIKGKYSTGDKYTLNEFKKFLYSNEDIFIDENGDFDSINNVCIGEVYEKLDYWESRIKDNKKSLKEDKLTDEEREVITAENKKLEEQILELKRRAEIRTLEDLPVDMSDTASGFFDIKYINSYLSEKMGERFKGDIIYNRERKLFTFADRGLNNIYTLHIAKGELDKKEKQEYEWGVRSDFSGEKNHLSMVMLDLMNGFSIGSASQDTQKRARDIEQNFKIYLAETAENRDQVENKYNREYNNFIQKEYDGSVIQGLTKLDYEKVVAYDKDGKPVKVKDKINPYAYAAVRRMYEQGKGLVAHGVGLGKTVEALLLGALSKETGKATKPTYVVPKSVAGNWNAEIQKWFTPDTKVLIIGAHRKEDKNGDSILDDKGREQWVEDNANEKKVKLSRIVNEDFDFIIMTKDFYTDIRLSPQTVDNMINELVDKFYVSRGDENDKAAARKREAIKHKLANEFLGSLKKDKFGKYAKTDEIYFENLGLDMVVADEAHSYKNLIESVLYSDIKYLNVKHSQRAIDFYFKSKILRNKNNDRGIYTLTATPLSNSPMEAFNMLLPIAEKEFEQMGIKNVDDFVKKFAEVDSIPTMSAAAKIVSKSVFTKFKNLNLLRKTFFKFSDYKTADIVGAQVHFPKENANFIFCDQSPEQKSIMKNLKMRLLLHEFKKSDMDKLVEDGFITEHEKKDLAEYKNIHDQKIKDFTPVGSNEDAKDFYFNILDDMKKATADLEWYQQKRSMWADPLPMGVDYAATPKVQQMLDNVTTIHKDGGKQLIFATNTTLHGKLKDQLVKAGIKPGEILIVNGGTVKSSDSRLKASEDFNNGKYKIVIGNYETMGEGLNFNIGTSDIHHLQPAWNSLAIDQGNGRGIRQGNILDNVNTHYYLTKGTIDAFFNQKILDKRGFVNAILTGKDDVMENDEGNLSADEMQIALAENPEQARKLLQRKNEAFAKLMKERKIKENFGKLDNYFSMNTRLGRMQDKESLAYKTLEKDIQKIKNQLNSSPDFDHKDILAQDTRPIILPGHNAVVKVGSVMDLTGGEKAIITNYSHSTGKVTLKKFSPYEVKTYSVDLRNFAGYYNNTIKPGKESAEEMFRRLITKDQTSNIDVIEALPPETFKRYKNQILANLQEGYSQHPVIARNKDGNYVGTTNGFAAENEYDIIFPQDSAEFFNLVDKATKTSDERYESGRGYYQDSSIDLAKKAAERVYGRNWEMKIKYLKQKAKGGATSEVDDLEMEEEAA